MISNFIIHWGTEVSIGLRVLSSIMVLFFLLPLQIKEAKVKNSLKSLRVELLACGIILLLINFFSLFFLIDLWMKDTPQKLTNSGLQIINALAYFALALLGNFMYRQQFTDEAKEFHAQIQKLEDEKKK